MSRGRGRGRRRTAPGRVESKSDVWEGKDSGGTRPVGPDAL